VDDSDDDVVVITASGTGLAGAVRLSACEWAARRASELGDFTLTIVDNAEGADTIEFAFQRGSGVNAYTYSFSGTVQAGSLNWSQWGP
jgi:hypothetical protein